ncbi:cytochrome P450 monooxygenase-like protein [Leptotrombidium deliense]|uniref:Cytochrome P450 monooxygenase-like protein n=1 Tax=Leptotrombidium deliense TaxID=299467 RepID=A0A443SPH6_9ACAR|nr:cytochrome P450 monooxygenase-like protein [Leptotrombidium deliense]
MLQIGVIQLLELLIVPQFIYRILRRKPTLFQSFDFFEELVKHVIKEREKLKEKPNDFLQMMLDAVENEHNAASNEADKSLFDKDLVVAQSILFLLAGYETTSTLLTFCSYILTTNPEMQEELYSELSRIVSDDSHIDYDAIMTAPYLNAFISETLRYYPPALRFERISVADYSIPEYNIDLPKGSTITFSPYFERR